jgi:hypothetical protein
VKRCRTPFIVRSLLLAGMLLASPPLEHAEAARGPYRLVPFGYLYAHIRTDGQTVVWSTRGSRNYSALLTYDPASGTLVIISQNLTSGHLSSFDLAAGTVVWSEGASAPGCTGACPTKVFAYDLATGNRRLLDDRPTTKFVVGLSEGIVIWQEGTTLRGLDLASGGPPRLIADGMDPAPWTLYSRPRVAGGAVVWSETMATLPGPVVRSRVRRLDLAHPRPTATVLELDGHARLVGVPGAWLIVAEERRTHLAVHAATGRVKPLADQIVSPAYDGRYLYWTIRRSVGPAGPEHTDLWAHDLTTDSVFLAAQDLPFTFMATAERGLLVGMLDEGASQTIFGLARAEVLPTAPRPAASSPDRTYYPETGHSLAAGFKGFWERGGGLPTFGFPLTEEFSQRNADTGQWYTVQYLERQRFEYHPELAGTPYEVSLGHLGAEDAAARADLAGLWAFNPVAADAAHPPGCRFVAATNHRLCGEFRPYWEVHGLDLGDGGLSEREALALFGYPISEEFIDPRTGLITQYFERAVFEYHPELPAVLSRRARSRPPSPRRRSFG